MSMARLILILLGAFVLHAKANAHEPYLLLTANADGTFTAEAGFSDGVSTEGLKLILRDRGSGALLSEHRLPANGKLSLKMPALPFRVVFEGGSGHRISKPGPAWEGDIAPSATAATPATTGGTATESASAPGTPRTPARVSETSPTNIAAVTPPPSQPNVSSTTSPSRDATTRVLLIVGIFFLFGSIAFALGYGAGRRAR